MSVVTLPPRHSHWPFMNLLLLSFLVNIFPSLNELFIFPLQLPSFIYLHCSSDVSCLPPECRFFGINCWTSSGIFQKALVALVYFPPFLISCFSLLYNIRNKVKKDFQGVTLKGPQKVSTDLFTYP